MGANQSSDGSHGSSRAQSKPTKQCYYELLGIDKQASDDEIKKAYRKKALELHPDRNYGNVEETTELFAAVQSAYEVLSDPQERAWYDSHRREILWGNDRVHGNHYERDVRITTTEDILRMLPRISACRDFSTSPLSFYGILHSTFDALAKEEELACERESHDPVIYPSFGGPNDQYESTVRSFYTAWGNFSTRKAFLWVDVYRYSEAPDRRVRRLMEKENRRLRDEAIREFNDSVGSLVAFVKKRDPRYRPTVQSEAERQKVLKDAAVAQAARSRAANQAKMIQSTSLPRWTQPNDTEPSEASDTHEEEALKETYECILCKKLFRSEQQFQAHEKSKKHIKAAQQIRTEMQYEDSRLDLAQPMHEQTNLGSASRSVIPESPPNDAVLDAFESGLDVLSIDDETLSTSENSFLNSNADNSSATEVYRRTAAALAVTSTPDNESPDRGSAEQYVVGQQKLPKNGCGLGNQSSELDRSLGLASTGNSTGEDTPRPERKVGRAKAKRARKAAQKLAASASTDAQVGPLMAHIRA
ncbi:MAG: hypothetical protein Q9210_001346 [Variospora velana]